MNQDGSWTQMVQEPDTNFDEFLNVGDFNLDGLDFGAFDASAAAGKDGEGLHTRPEAAISGGARAQESFMGAQMPALMENEWGPRHHQRPSAGMEPGVARSEEEQMRYQHQHHNQQMQQHAQPQTSHPHPPLQQDYAQTYAHMAVPPTPDSVEMHGRPAYPGMSHQQARVMYESYSRKQQEQASLHRDCSTGSG